MDSDYYLNLIYRELDGLITAVEAGELRAWEAESPENKRFADELRDAWQSAEAVMAHPEVDLDTEFDALTDQLGDDWDAEVVPFVPEEREEEVLPPAKPKRRIDWLAIGTAAAAIFILYWTVGDFLLNPDKPITSKYFAEDEVKTVTLPDGSVVTLNLSSQLEFTEAKEKGERQVKLNGEAYFEVAKDENHPFIITSGPVEIRVLGTKFNLRNYTSDKSATLRVSEGRVQFGFVAGGNPQVVNAGEVVKANFGDQSFDKDRFSGQNTASWRNDKLVFEDMKLSDAAKDIEELYDIKLKIEAGDCPYTGTFENLPTREVLESIATVIGGEIETLTEGVYEIKGGSCD